MADARKPEKTATWHDRRILDLLGIESPILLAPMAGAALSDLGIAVAEAGGLGSIPCAMLSVEEAKTEVQAFRQRTSCPLHLNFFCHRPPARDAVRENAWRERLAPYYRELGLDPEASLVAPTRNPFDQAMCDFVVDARPEVVSFHFGLPNRDLFSRVKATGAKVLGSATTVEEARWLESAGCDAVIAQGSEAGGHRGMFLTDDVSTQIGTMALVPQVVDAVKVPVIAAGGIGDARGIAAAFALGGSAVQMGTAYLLCPESRISAVHRAALRKAVAENTGADRTAITNVFSGRPARGIVNRLVREAGPVSAIAPEFPLAGSAIAPLRKASESAGSQDFAQMWAGQAVHLAQEMPAAELTLKLAAETLKILVGLAALG